MNLIVIAVVGLVKASSILKRASFLDTSTDSLLNYGCYIGYCSKLLGKFCRLRKLNKPTNFTWQNAICDSSLPTAQLSNITPCLF